MRGMRKGVVTGAGLAAVTAVLFVSICGAALGGPSGTRADVPSIAPLNPAFVAAMANQSAARMRTSDGAHGLGYFPAPVELPKVRPAGVSAASLPSSYDLRALGRVTPVRDQGAHGTCWAFASLGSVESALLPDESWDFSEDNLVNGSGFAGVDYESGGDAQVALAYLARWAGPVAEASDPYETPGVPALPAAKHLQSAAAYPGRQGNLDNAALKTAVMTSGGVYVSMQWEDAYYDDSTSSYYYNQEGDGNHAVVIVGWDDSYSRTNFSGSAAGAPAGNGAFIVRNSWDTSFGDGGYFYVSYYDAAFARSTSWSFTRAEATSNYTANYQYDPLGWTDSCGYGSTTGWFANLFTAQAGANVTAVSFYSATAGAPYEVYAGSSLTALTLVGSGTLSEAGYFTVPLGTAYPVAAGAKFYVAVKLTTPSYNYPIPLEAPVQGWANTSASAGQSYISSNGTTWSDVTSHYTRTNVCLKAFTGAASTRYEQADANLYFQGTWSTTKGTSYSGGSCAYANVAGTSVTATFTGTSVAYIAKTASNQGVARITLDGGTPVLVSLYSSKTKYQQQVWSASGLGAGSHTLVVAWTGTKTAGSGTTINLDALDITGTLLSTPRPPVASSTSETLSGPARSTKSQSPSFLANSSRSGIASMPMIFCAPSLRESAPAANPTGPSPVMSTASFPQIPIFWSPSYTVPNPQAT